MTECTKYTVDISQQLDPQTVIEALKKCSRLRDTGEPPIHLGKGGFGVVYGFVIRRKNRLGIQGSPIKVAIKMQVIKKGKLINFIKESQYAAELGDKGISPKIYSAFYYDIKNNRASRLRRSGTAIGIIVMERFQMSVFDALTKTPKYVEGRYIQQMLIGVFNVIDRMLEENIYCNDFKPDNFVVNFLRKDPVGEPTLIDNVDVALIDFSADFCSRQAPHYIQTIKGQARTKLYMRGREQGDVDKIPGWKNIHEATARTTEAYPQILYGNILKIALILNVSKILKYGYTDNMRKFLLSSFYEFLNYICNSDALLENITESLVDEELLYIMFMHNVRASDEVKNVPQAKRREHVIVQLKKLCDIKRHLDNVPSAIKKAGIKAKIKKMLHPSGGSKQHKKSILIKKMYYGIKKGKVIPIYGHKIFERIGRHKFFITWKTTKKNLPGKTFHGTFYNTRKAAQDKYLTRRERRTRRRRPKKKHYTRKQRRHRYKKRKTRHR